MPRTVKDIQRELEQVRALVKELAADIPDPDMGPKAVKGKYPPLVVANVREKARALEAELAEALKKESPERYVTRKISGLLD